jgi:hypothetical protein
VSLNRGDPFHVALLNLALAAAKLVDDLHEYEHWLTGGDSELFRIRDVEQDYDQITRAWQAFRDATSSPEVEQHFGSGVEGLAALGDGEE